MVRRALTGLALGLALTAPVSAEDSPWDGGGLSWSVADGTPLGEPTTGQVLASRTNVVANAGMLQLRLGSSGETFTGAQVVSHQKLGFGTATWDLEFPADMPASAVLTLGFQGPAAGDGALGENTISVDFSRWSTEISGDNTQVAVYPPPGTGSIGGLPTQEASATLSLKGPVRVVLVRGPRQVQARFFVAGRLADTEVLSQGPADGEFPQGKLPAVMTLWNFGLPAVAPWEVTVRSFSFSPKP
jgi:hypothetical protein